MERSARQARRVCGIALAMLACGSAVLAAERPVEPPRTTPLRYNEDWRFLREDAGYSAWPSQLKELPLGEPASWRLSVGAEVRERYERLGNPNWGEEPTDNDGYLWSRVLPVIDLQNEERRLRFFTELNLAYATSVDPEPGPFDQDRGDFLQLFADFGDPYAEDGPRLRVGRQVLALGSQRLVGTRYGVNVIRSFDSVELALAEGDARLRALYARPTEVLPDAFDNKISDDQQLWGAYSTLPFREHSNLDLYYLGFVDDLAVFQQTAGREVRHSIGTRFFGGFENWFWNVEAVGQFGRIGNADILAWTTAIEAGRAFEKLPMRPRFDLKLDFISGDVDTADGTVGTFNPLFPSLKYFGESGVLAPYNLIDLHPTITFDVSETVQVGADVDFFWRYSTDDAVYGPGGGILRDGSLSDERYIATQYEIFVEAELASGLVAFVSWTTLPPGDFIKSSGASETIHFVAAELTWIF
ncbi:MAG: alginate export family protein [Planctomycetota bacterium]